MRHFLSVLFSAAVFSVSLSPAIGYAGDCNKTVMGGGCSGQVDSGVAPHMHSQNPVNAEAKTKVKATAAAPAVKPAAAKAVKVSNATGQKPQI